MSRLRKNGPATLPPEVAREILAKVFTNNDRPSNTISFEDLSSYSEYRSDRYLLLRVFITIMLIFFILIPLLFFPPTLVLQMRTDTAPNKRAYNATVSSVIPIKSITAVMNGRTIPVHEVAGKEYLILPTDNGNMQVTVTLKNGQISSEQIAVEGIDTEAPKLIDITFDDDYMHVYLTDPAGIDPLSITLTASDGSPRQFSELIEADSCITIPYPREDLKLSVADRFGNTLDIDINAQN